MDHKYIEQFDLIDRYLMGRLVAEESERFEEHFIDCPECINRLKTTRDFREGFKQFALEEVKQEKGRERKRSRWFSWEWPSVKNWAFAAYGVLLVAVLISLFLISRIRGLQFEADQAKNASAEWQRRFEEQQQAASSSEQQHQETEQSLNEQLRGLEAELEDARKQQAESAGTSQAWMRAGINLPIFVLTSVRGGGGQNPANVNEITLSRTSENFVISVPLEGETRYKTYRVTILSDNHRFWGSTGLKPDRYNSLTIGFNSNFFPAGDYSLKVEGVPGKPDSSLIGIYPLHIRKK